MVFNPRIQVGDIKPLGPVWARRPIDRVQRKENKSESNEEQPNKQSQEQNKNEDDGHSIDEFA